MRSAIALALAIGSFALAGVAVAQSPAKGDAPAAAPVKQSDAASEHRKSRAERRAEAGADAKSDSLTEFPKTAGAAPAKPKMECRKQEVTGSRMGKNICATPEQWAEADKQALEAVRQMRSEASSKAGQAALGGPYTSGGRP
jgi:hypothetical protein